MCALILHVMFIKKTKGGINTLSQIMFKESASTCLACERLAKISFVGSLTGK